MGILDRLRGKAHHHEDPAARAALAHDEAADAFAVDVEKTRDLSDKHDLTGKKTELSDDDRRAAENMTAEGDPWD